MAQNVSVRFLIISDTHTAPPAPSNAPFAYRHPLPKADVLLHCGDLTMEGDIQEYHDTLAMLSGVDAELKLVIAGNHDLSLDEHYFDRHSSVMVEEQAKKKAARDIWKGSQAEAAGVKYLEEGMYTFALKSGASFSVYASPYTPEFCNMGFPYRRNEDRFNPWDEQVDLNTSCIAKNPIPDFPAVDIIMTHGPPREHLGTTGDKVDAGCKNLLHALRRAKPRMHCFGHIHERWGAEVVEWSAPGEGREKTVFSRTRRSLASQAQQEAERLDVTSNSDMPLQRGQQTLLVNAAIMDVRYRPTNRPWLIDMDLPKK